MQGSALIPPAFICTEVLRFGGPISVLLHLTLRRNGEGFCFVSVGGAMESTVESTA